MWGRVAPYMCAHLTWARILMPGKAWPPRSLARHDWYSVNMWIAVCLVLWRPLCVDRHGSAWQSMTSEIACRAQVMYTASACGWHIANQWNNCCSIGLQVGATGSLFSLTFFLVSKPSPGLWCSLKWRRAVWNPSHETKYLKNSCSCILHELCTGCGCDRF